MTTFVFQDANDRSELDRKNNEYKRINDEKQRKIDENNRIAKENERIKNENQRKLDENSRIEAEKDRRKGYSDFITAKGDSNLEGTIEAEVIGARGQATNLKERFDGISLQLSDKASKSLNENNSSLSKNSSISNFIKKMISGTSCKIASLGDSITDCGNVTSGVTGGASSPDKGWFSLLSKYLQNTYGYGINCTNRGVGGQKVSEAFNRIKTQIIPFDYDLIIIELGTNDWNYGTSLQQFEIDYRRLIKELVETTRASLLTVGLGWFKDHSSKYKVAEDWQYNAIIKKVALEYNIAYVDTRSAMLYSGHDWNDIVFIPDPVHPNDLGHKIWYETVKQFVDYNGFLTENDFRKTEFEYVIKPEQIRSNKDVTISKNDEYYFGNSCYVNSNNSTALYFRFFGTAIKIIYTKHNLYGKAKIYVDGGEVMAEIDMYNDEITFKNIKEITNLKLGWHFVSIFVDDKNNLSNGYGINLEGVLIKNIIKEERLSFKDKEIKTYNTIFYENPFPSATCYSLGYPVINSISNRNIRVDTNPVGQGGYLTVTGF